MTFQTLARAISDDAIMDVLRGHYEMTTKQVHDMMVHLDVFRETVTANEPDGTFIDIRAVIAEGQYAIDVAGIRPPDETPLAIDMHLWADWAAMRFYHRDGIEMSDAERVAHALYEMTWHGSEAESQAMRDRIFEQLKDITLPNGEIDMTKVKPWKRPDWITDKDMEDDE